MTYNVEFTYDPEADVWIATSDDIIGLVLESENLDHLMKRVEIAVPELLELNHQVPAEFLNFKQKRALSTIL